MQPTQSQNELEMEMEIVNRRIIASNIRRYLNEEGKQRDYQISPTEIENSHIQLKV